MLYWGFFPLETNEEKRGLINEVDTLKIDVLFPLSIGKEASFSEVIGRAGAQDSETPIWAHINVREKTNLEIKIGQKEVFVIDITTDKTTLSGVVK
jgi:hypothetical protein